ncbi:hypothetical protein [Deinococcus yavapaiensis]|uniref:HEAT repeat protein n=1 Tax=Deinococcus yavapaiensis KR-236 TaxID=694435 RepID=A0A318SCR0_9DEIO|nr:hypothetical protein [Deinococcus yavapaiensis]PYE49490.1 hypothetical protein DES52_12236 [Deinococcus yavapaiensis KR-236]
MLDDLAAFERALHDGLGRALLHLQRASDAERTAVRAVVLDACVRDTAFDAQLEGRTSVYLADAAKLTGVWPDVRPHVLRALDDLRDTTAQFWDARQLVELLKLLAFDGDEHAARELRARFRQAADADDQLVRFFGPALLDLRGLRILPELLRDIGRALRRDAERVEDGELLQDARGLFGEDVVNDLLRVHEHDEDVRAYLDRVEELAGRVTANSSERAALDVSLAWARREVERSRTFNPSLMRWGERAADADVAELARDLDVERDSGRLKAMLTVFLRRPFPRDPTRLIALAEHDDSVVSYRAVRALGHLQHPDVRTLALRLLRTPGREGDGAELLHGHVELGDEDLLTDVASRASTWSPDERHAFVKNVTKLADAHPTSALLTLLASLFALQPCAACRALLVRALAVHDALPDWLREEAAWDASEELRAFVASLMHVDGHEDRPGEV